MAAVYLTDRCLSSATLSREKRRATLTPDQRRLVDTALEATRHDPVRPHRGVRAAAFGGSARRLSPAHAELGLIGGPAWRLGRRLLLGIARRGLLVVVEGVRTRGRRPRKREPLADRRCL